CRPPNAFFVISRMVFTSPAEPMLRLLSWLERCIVFPSTVRSAPLYPRVAAAGGAPSLPRNRRGISIRGKKRGQIPRSCRQSSRARRPYPHPFARRLRQAMQPRGNPNSQHQIESTARIAQLVHTANAPANPVTDSRLVGVLPRTLDHGVPRIDSLTPIAPVSQLDAGQSRSTPDFQNSRFGRQSQFLRKCQHHRTPLPVDGSIHVFVLINVGPISRRSVEVDINTVLVVCRSADVAQISS